MKRIAAGLLGFVTAYGICAGLRANHLRPNAATNFT